MVHSARYLGFWISSDLSWAAHINKICSKARQFCGFLYRYFNGAGSHCLARLYSSIVLPILDYGSAVWDPHQAKYITQLERTQRFAARIVIGKWVRDATGLLPQLGWLRGGNTSSSASAGASLWENLSSLLTCSSPVHVSQQGNQTHSLCSDRM